MHCSANVGNAGDMALFFGLSGTGKTTLSSDPERRLIGDDEHGWGDDGVFNFEGGCYAKTINLRADLEPLIWNATRHFGTVLENVTVDSDTRRMDFDDDQPDGEHARRLPDRLHRQHRARGRGGHPQQHLLPDRRCLRRATAHRPPDPRAGHVLLPLRLHLQAGRHRERLGKEPQTTFSTCFGAPFLPLPPGSTPTCWARRSARHNVEGLAGEHRLDRRTVRRRQAHSACPTRGP